MTAPTWSPVDEATADLLELLAADWTPFAEADRNLIARAIRDDAESHGGWVSSNRVRAALAGQVKPQRVGPTYRALCLLGALEVDGWDVNDGSGIDRENSGNSGRPMRTYRWLREATA